MPPYKAIAKPIAATGVTRTSKNQAWKLSFNHLQSIADISNHSDFHLISVWLTSDWSSRPLRFEYSVTLLQAPKPPVRTINDWFTFDGFHFHFSLSVRVFLWSALTLTLILLSFTWIEQWSSLQKHAIINRVNTIWRVSRCLRFIWNQNETMDCETRARSSICITSNNISNPSQCNHLPWFRSKALLLAPPS